MSQIISKYQNRKDAKKHIDPTISDASSNLKNIQHTHNVISNPFFLYMLLDGVGLALITACTLYDAYEIWSIEFKYNYTVSEKQLYSMYNSHPVAAMHNNLYEISPTSASLMTSLSDPELNDLLDMLNANYLAITYWFVGRAMQVIGLWSLIMHAATLQKYINFEIFGMFLLTIGPICNIIATCFYKTIKHMETMYPIVLKTIMQIPNTHNYMLGASGIHAGFNLQWNCSEVVELIGILLLDLTVYYEIVLHQKSLFSKHAAQRPLNSMHQNYASSIETMNATEKETPNPDGYWSFLTNFEVDGHVNLIIEIIGFLVLIAAAVCEYVYKYESAALPGVDTLSPNTRIRFESYVVLSQYYGFWKGLYLYWMQYVPDAIRFRYDLSHCTDGLGLILLIIVAFGLYSISLNEENHQIHNHHSAVKTMANANKSLAGYIDIENSRDCYQTNGHTFGANIMASTSDRDK